MTTTEPTTEVDSRFGEAGVGPIPWAEGRQVLETASQYWISSVRSDGRPHVAPLVGVWHEDAMYFATGPDEQKARNVASHPHVVLTTGTNDYAHGLDVVVEGEAVRVTDDADLRRVADVYLAKYGAVWHFDVVDGTFRHNPESVRPDDIGPAHVFRVAPTKVLGFGKGPFSQTRWRFTS